MVAGGPLHRSIQAVLHAADAVDVALGLNQINQIHHTKNRQTEMPSSSLSSPLLLPRLTAAALRCRRHRPTHTPNAGNATVAGPRPLAPTTFSRYVSKPRRVQIVGAPLADGQPLLGVDRGPTFIRSHGLVQRLVRRGFVRYG